MPGNNLPEIKFNWFEIDTLVHVCMYFGLSFLMLIGFFHIKNELFFKLGLYIIVVCISIGLGIELLQGSVIPLRFFSWKDIVANSIGTIFGLLLFLYYRKKEFNMVRFLQ